ncbi:MAG: FAD-dependent oxidoreductase [Bacteroidota bacterium]
MSKTNVKFLQASVDKISLSDRKMQIAKAVELRKEEDGASQDLEFDYIVLAPGSEPALQIVPGAKEHAECFHSLSDAYQLRTLIRCLRENPSSRAFGNRRVTVVGGGYSGVELAASLATLEGAGLEVALLSRSSEILPGFYYCMIKFCLG